MSSSSFGPETLRIDPEAETVRITTSLRELLSRRLKRRGAIVALSGGIDSSTVAALCVRALGSERVFGLQLPERDSSGDSLSLSGLLAEALGIETHLQDISPVLETLGCYERQREAIRRIVPEFAPEWKFKLVLPDLLEEHSLRIFSLVAVSPEGEEIRRRLDSTAYLGLVAATNFKQRVRKMLEYYHADRLNYAVCGTPNRLECDQGFFVKLGDGAADVKPIAHLYKSQVYQLAGHLGVPEEILRRPPTTDTYSLPQSQEEFYFSLDYERMDLCLYGKNHGLPEHEVAEAAGISREQLKRVYADIDQKRRSTAYLHEPPLLIEEIPEI
jgi:NAD+ synthase